MPIILHVTRLWQRS